MSVRVLAIDPGTHESGWALLDGEDERVEAAGVTPNAHLKEVIARDDYDVLAIEKIVSYGSAVGQETFDTCVWIGRFMEWSGAPDDVLLIPRRKVVKHLCGTGRFGDPEVRQACIKRMGAPGTKKAPGPTYGCTSHAWQALAVAITAQDEIG